MKIVNTEPKRDAVLFVRVQEKNKKYVEREAKKAGFKDAATWVDKLLTSLREKGEKNG
jgi:hypothetical protein